MKSFLAVGLPSFRSFSFSIASTVALAISAEIARSQPENPATAVPVLEFPTIPTERGEPSTETSKRLSKRIFNIDFGPWIPKGETSGQEGPAATGHENDFWNIVGIPWSNYHRVERMIYASGDSSTIQVELKNLGGAWSSQGKMGVKSPMLDSYHYPMNNQGGNSEVILHKVYPGRWAVMERRG